MIVALGTSRSVCRRPSAAKSFASTLIALIAIGLLSVDSTPAAGRRNCRARRGDASRRDCGTGVGRVARTPVATPAPDAAAKTVTGQAKPSWRPLFDGKSLDGWKITNFGGEGDVTIQDDAIELGFGSSLTGVTYERDVPKTNYEIRLEAMRLDGIDFFCGLTFPVADSHCSFIVAGWAGSVVGLSCIDGQDASNNETTSFHAFANNRWYRIRVRVEPQRIQAWIDDQQVVDQDITGRKISTRSEVDLSRPLGISAWQTKAALRQIEVRELPEQ